MAVAHIDFNHDTRDASRLTRYMLGLEENYNGLNRELATLALMIDGDPSNAANYTYMKDRYSFVDNAEAKGAYDELSSLMFKLNTNGSVTDVNAALLQAFNKFR